MRGVVHLVAREGNVRKSGVVIAAICSGARFGLSEELGGRMRAILAVAAVASVASFHPIAVNAQANAIRETPGPINSTPPQQSSGGISAPASPWPKLQANPSPAQNMPTRPGASQNIVGPNANWTHNVPAANNAGLGLDKNTVRKTMHYGNDLYGAYKLYKAYKAAATPQGLGEQVKKYKDHFGDQCGTLGACVEVNPLKDLMTCKRKEFHETEYCKEFRKFRKAQRNAQRQVEKQIFKQPKPSKVERFLGGLLNGGR